MPKICALAFFSIIVCRARVAWPSWPPACPYFTVVLIHKTLYCYPTAVCIPLLKKLSGVFFIGLMHMRWNRREGLNSQYHVTRYIWYTELWDLWVELWPVPTKSHRMAIGWTSDGHRIAIGWTFYRMGSVPNFSNGWKLFFKDYINLYIYLSVSCTFYFVFIMLCYIFFAVNVALSILSKSNLHPFYIWCVWILYSIV